MIDEKPILSERAMLEEKPTGAERPTAEAAIRCLVALARERDKSLTAERANQREKPSSSERLTSELERFCRRPTYLGWDEGAFRAALQSDWENGRPEELQEIDASGMARIICSDGYQGYVGCIDPKKRPLADFRSIRKNGNPTWRYVFAKTADGKIIHAGKLRRQTQWAKEHGHV